jgi:hypothetical protein
VTLVSAVVVNYRQPELLAACLESVTAALDDGELIVVENASHDGSAELVAERFPGARLVVLEENLGFAGGVMRGLEEASGEWIALVNNDAVIERDALRLLVAAGAADPKIGAVAAQVRFADRRELVNSAGLEVDRLGIGYDRLVGTPIDGPAQTPAEVFGANGCFGLYRRAMLDSLGGFDESFFAYMEDADLAWRARMAGWRSAYEPRAIAFHEASATARQDLKYRLVGRNRVRMLAKNATGRQLLRHGVAILAYDLAYVVAVAITDRSLAPLRGRLSGLRDWRRYRRAGASQRRAVDLVSGGWRQALAMRRTYRR